MAIFLPRLCHGALICLLLLPKKEEIENLSESDLWSPGIVVESGVGGKKNSYARGCTARRCVRLGESIELELGAFLAFLAEKKYCAIGKCEFFLYLFLSFLKKKKKTRLCKSGRLEYQI